MGLKLKNALRWWFYHGQNKYTIGPYGFRYRAFKGMHRFTLLGTFDTADEALMAAYQDCRQKCEVE